MKQREIKYKSLYRGEWYEVEEMFLENGNATPTKFKGENFSPDSEHVKCTVQYTGLKDKNGKDIYDGDVLEMDDSESTKGVVIFDEGSFRLKEKSIYYSHLSAWKTDIMSTVIGNIYEHPGLLV